MGHVQDASVSIVILNYNSWKDTLVCLESVSNIDYSPLYVIVVDNGSEDDSIAHLSRWANGEERSCLNLAQLDWFRNYGEVRKPIGFLEYERKETFLEEKPHYKEYREGFVSLSEEKKSGREKLYFIYNKCNLGYAGGNNVGIRYALNCLNVDYILVLNNDTVVPSDLIVKLLDVFRTEDDAGMCGPVEYSYENPSEVVSAGGRFGWYSGVHREIKTVTKDSAAVDWISGSCLFLKSDLIPKVGYFDERFFLYVEEVDLAYRYKACGYRVMVTPEACIWHKGGTTPKDIYFTRNRLLFSLKHLSRFELGVFLPIHIIKWVLLRPFLDVIRKNEFNFLRNFNALKDGLTAYKEKRKKYFVQKDDASRRRADNVYNECL